MLSYSTLEIRKSMKKEKYEITLLKGNTPNKNCTTFIPEALANAVENYNKTHLYVTGGRQR